MYAATANEKKRKRKSLLLALFLQAGVIGGLLFPFLSNALEPDQPEYESVIVMDFTSFDKASAKPAKAKSAAPKKQEKKTAPEPKPVVKPLPTKKPVVTAPTPTPPVLTVPDPQPIPEPEPQVIPEPVVEATPEPTVDPTPEPVMDAPVITTESSEVGGSGSGDSGTGSADGTAATDGDGDSATPGTGNSGRDFSGDGIFGRRVIYRADVKGLTREPGKLVVNLCVNRTGRVTYVSLNEEETTIEDPSLRANAQQVTRKYKFEKDYTAPREQCGKLTFIFKLPAE